MSSLRVPSPQTRHLLSRFSYGVTPGLVNQARRQGGPRAWLEWQMKPGAIPDRYANGLQSWFPSLSFGPERLWRAHLAHTRRSRQVSYDFVRWTMLRRTYSRRQLHEAMTDFWSNLLHVPAPDEKSWPYRFRYDLVIRRHALGRFDDMLVAAITHPAMGCYLDNARSTKRQLNENLGRELLELHTVGRASGYTERDVLHSARILTGFRVDAGDTWRRYYAPSDHDTGRVRVLGFSSPNRNPDGRKVTKAYLNYLAHHPATARNIARRMCVRFVQDQPTLEHVNAVARAYLRSGTDIRATLRALVRHPDFRRSVGVKVRTPSEDAIASYRSLRLRIQRPRTDADFANFLAFQSEFLGQRPFDWPQPDGTPDVADAWTSAGRLLNSWTIHRSLSAGSPSQGVRHRPTASWLPPLPARFEEVVDHLSRRMLARRATSALCDAAATHVDIPRSRLITHADDLPAWRMTLLLSTILNSPAHLTR